jgi:nucleotide-binding universal stress UspA family protein
MHVTVQPHTSLLGIAIAITFAVVMGLIMYWMFRVPRPVTAEVAKARRSLDIARLILVPTTGQPYSQRAVELACRLALEQRAEIMLVYVVEVPRTLGLDAPLEPAEQEAQHALETGREIVLLHNLPVRTLVRRAREAGDGIIAAAKDHSADLIVMGIAGNHRGHTWGRTAEALLQRAPCEVIFDRLPSA